MAVISEMKQETEKANLILKDGRDDRKELVDVLDGIQHLAGLDDGLDDFDSNRLAMFELCEEKQER